MLMYYISVTLFIVNIMPKKLTQEEFIKRAVEVHNDKYDYSKVNYINNTTKICIICPKHGAFFQTPNMHLYQKQGCKKCRSDKMKKKICGVGINDYHGVIKIKDKHIKSYQVWHEMLLRCYDGKTQRKHPTYSECSVCDEWLSYSNFKKWFDDNYIEGYELDKDIFIKGNKVYSPNTCCFVPKNINLLLIKRGASRGNCAIGVSKNRNYYIARLSKYGKQVHIGCFKTEQEAYLAYKKAKEETIKEVAYNSFLKKEINSKIYEALLNYKVEITD